MRTTITANLNKTTTALLALLFLTTQLTSLGLLITPQVVKADTGITKIDSIERPTYLMGSIVVDDSGNMFTLGFNPFGSSQNPVRKYNPSGDLITEWGGSGTGDNELLYPGGLGIDTDENIYVSDSASNLIKKFNSSGQYLSQLGSFGSGAGQFDEIGSLSFDSNNNLFVVDRGNYRIQKFDSTGNFISTWGWGVDDGTNEFQICTTDCQQGISGNGSGEFEYPGVISVDANGSVFIADTNNYRIQKFDSTGNFISTWGWGVDDGTNEFQICTTDCQQGISGNGSSQFSDDIGGIAHDSMSNIYVTDSGNNRIQKFSNSGNYLTHWSSQGSGNGEFFYPYGVTINSSNIIYVVDTYNYRIQKFDNDGNFLAVPVQQEIPFQLPVSVVKDLTGNLYVSNLYGFNVSKFDSSNNFITSWMFDFDLPYSTVASTTSLYTSAYNDQSDHVIIYKTDFSGNPITSWDTEGTCIGLALDSDENIFCSDIDQRVIKKYSSSGILLDEWGSSGSGDGQFGEQILGYIAIDSENNVYVPDTGNHRIQKFSSNGDYITQWGSESFGGNEFNPVSIAADKLGNIYVNDFIDNDDDGDSTVIRKFDTFGNYSGQYTQASDEQSGMPFLSYGIATGPNGRIYATNIYDSSIEILCDNDVSTDGCASTGSSNLTTLSSAENATPITLSQTGCTTVSNASTTKESSLTTADPAYSYPVGLVAFTLNGCTTGGTATITATITGSFDPNTTTIRKYSTSNNTYTTLTQSNSNLALSTTTLNNQPALQATYTITDGGPLDQDNTANGTIVDPVGLAQASVGVPNTGLR